MMKEMKELIKTIVAAHNQLIGLIQNAEMIYGQFWSAQIWRKIASEGAAIANTARALGIDATVVDTSAGTIIMKENDMPLDEIIVSLEDQAQDRDSFVDEDDLDCIFRHDAAALRAAIALLLKFKERQDVWTYSRTFAGTAGRDNLLLLQPLRRRDLRGRDLLRNQR